MTAVSTLRFSTWRRINWLHPEWWSLALSGAAWLLIILMAAPIGLFDSHTHATHHTVPATLTYVWAPSTQALMWLVMIVAMMFPILLYPIRMTAARSLWRRRHRAIAGFLTGYLIPWMLFGIAASLLIFVVQTQLQFKSEVAAAFGFGVALIWQVTPKKRRAAIACHRTLPIAPAGWRADRDCLRYGWMVSGSCLVSCWALMLACMLSGHGLTAMIGATAIGWTERTRARPNQSLLCAVIGMLGFTYVILAYV